MGMWKNLHGTCSVQKPRLAAFPYLSCLHVRSAGVAQRQRNAARPSFSSLFADAQSSRSISGGSTQEPAPSDRTPTKTSQGVGQSRAANGVNRARRRQPEGCDSRHATHPFSIHGCRGIRDGWKARIPTGGRGVAHLFFLLFFLGLVCGVDVVVMCTGMAAREACFFEGLKTEACARARDMLRLLHRRSGWR